MNGSRRQRSSANFHPPYIIMRNYPSLSTPTNLSHPWGRTGQDLMPPFLESKITRHLSCDVVFGSPSADCMGTGVCRITARTGNSPAVAERTRSCKSTVGLLFPIEGGKGVSLILTRTLICIQLYRAHVRPGILTLDNPCPLPKDVILKLGLKINELSIGKYPIQEGDRFLRIDF